MPARQLLAKIHIGKKECGLDDETYRAMLENLTGKRSAKDLNDRQIIGVINHLKSLGWQERRTGTQAGTPVPPKKYDNLKGRDAYAPSPQMLRKLDALFHDICYSDDQTAALRRFLFKRFKVSDPAFLDKRTCYEAIEAVKAIRKRQFG